MIDYQHISEEYVKCLADKSRIYMIENYLKTYDATQHREVAYKLFPRQKLLCQTMGNANNVVLTKPRQAGCTTTAGGFISCEMVLADKESPQTVLVIGNTLDLAQQMLFKIRDFLLQFPLWMWGDIEEHINLGYDVMKKPTNKKVIFEVCNSKELLLKNGCKVVARSSGPDASRGVGGVTWLIFDEAAFIENGNDVYASAIPTVSTGGHIIMISTPNGKDKLYYETCRQAKFKGTTGWNHFELVGMFWYQDPRYNKHLEWTKKNNDSGEYDIIKEPVLDASGSIEYNEEHWKQMISDGWKPRSPWYVKMCQQFNNDPQKIAQELDVSFLGSDSTVVAPEYIQMQIDLNVREPNPNLKDITLEDMWIWKPPFEGHRYIISIDNSRGSSDDATAMEIIDLDGIDDNGEKCIEQVAEYNGKLTGDIIGEIAYQYGVMYNNAFIIVEDIGGYGSSTLVILQRMKYKNLYYDDPNLKRYTNQNDASSTQVTENGWPGFHSTSVRFQMLSSFADMVRTNQFKIRSARVCNELDTWVFVPGSRGMDHKDGCHDDTITCLAMGMFVVQYSLNKQIEQKEKDKTMLQAIVQANSRLVRIETTTNTISDKQLVGYSYIRGKEPEKPVDNKEKYKMFMWVKK